MEFLIFVCEHCECENCPNQNLNECGSTCNGTSGSAYAENPNSAESNSGKLRDDENINHPSHYTQGKYEVIDVIEDWDLGFHLSNALKYIARANYKGNREQDLRKAIWYIQREIGLNKK